MPQDPAYDAELIRLHEIMLFFFSMARALPEGSGFGELRCIYEHSAWRYQAEINKRIRNSM